MVTFPTWFIYFFVCVLAFNAISGLVNIIRLAKRIEKMSHRLASIVAPMVSEEVTKHLKVELEDRINDEYIVIKKPVRKAKKEKTEDA